MIRHTGGCAAGDIRTRSSPSSYAIFSALADDMMPTASPLTPITRTSLSEIASLTSKSFVAAMAVHLRKMKKGG